MTTAIRARRQQQIVDLGVDTTKVNVEDLISFVTASHLIPGRSGGSIHINTLLRYANRNKGCRPIGSMGPAVVLPSVVCTGKRWTTAAWVELFKRKCDELAQNVEPEPIRPPTPLQQQKAHERAKRNLRKQGFSI